MGNYLHPSILLTPTKYLIKSKLGALLPGNAKASGIVDKYLDRVIDKASPALDLEKSDESARQNSTMLSSLMNQNVSKKVSNSKNKIYQLRRNLANVAPSAYQRFYDGYIARWQGE